MDPETMETPTDSNRYLRHLARLYPSVEAVSGEIIHLRAQLDLPKGTDISYRIFTGNTKPFEAF